MKNIHNDSYNLAIFIIDFYSFFFIAWITTSGSAKIFVFLMTNFLLFLSEIYEDIYLVELHGWAWPVSCSYYCGFLILKMQIFKFLWHVKTKLGLLARFSRINSWDRFKCKLILKILTPVTPWSPSSVTHLISGPYATPKNCIHNLSIFISSFK